MRALLNLFLNYWKYAIYKKNPEKLYATENRAHPVRIKTFDYTFKLFTHTQGRRKVSDIGGSTWKKVIYEVGTYLRFSCERFWQKWLF